MCPVFEGHDRNAADIKAGALCICTAPKKAVAYEL
uniref:Uncharacterized protein n=1 Tax=Arundo donax TaxID=35708 RepID=A0A0A9HS23_ARUDO